jgi:hypothetical protein
VNGRLRDERLRFIALQSLAADTPPLAREALESGVVELEPAVLTWTGSLGAVTAHRVVLRVNPELRDRVGAAPAAVDALVEATAKAITSTSGDTLAELIIVGDPVSSSNTTAYRGRL